MTIAHPTASTPGLASTSSRRESATRYVRGTGHIFKRNLGLASQAGQGMTVTPGLTPTRPTTPTSSPASRHAAEYDR